MGVKIIVYKNLIRQCRKYMAGLRPSSWLWQTNAMSIHHYIQKIREVENDKIRNN